MTINNNNNNKCSTTKVNGSILSLLIKLLFVCLLFKGTIQFLNDVVVGNEVSFVLSIRKHSIEITIMTT